ncbi:D-alanyl-D-alanine carboxypeptidase family protein [Actinoplanes siamensis]|nr:D-alanyl-D-alanine carboxypeptidase [Actinoplanes siamensis]
MTQAAEPNDGTGRETPAPPESGSRPATGSARVPVPRPAESAVQHSPPQPPVRPGRATVPVPNQPPFPNHPPIPHQPPFPQQPAVPHQPQAPGPTTYQSGGGTAPQTPRKSRRLAAVLVAVFLLVALLGGGAAVQLTRDLPAATLTTGVAGTLKIPGSLPEMPWPARGSAELMVEGLGRIGGSGGARTEPIGSVAKVMTAYVILKNHPLEGDDEGPGLTVTAADVADYNSRIPSGQSLVRVEQGEKLTERDALEALMLPSANNIAHQLAVWDAGDLDGFLEKMNAAADELQMTDTEYTDPSGFLPSTTSTAADQVKLARAVLEFEVFADIVELRTAQIPVVGTIQNYNALLGVDGVFGIKTGSTDQAGGNLVFASRLKVGSRELVIVGAVFNQPGANTPEQLAAVNKEVRKLLAAVRRTVKEYQLLAAKPVGRVETAWGASTTVTPASPLKVVGWPGLSVKVETTTAGPGARVGAGQVVGEVQASGVRVPLRTDGATGEPSLWWRLTRTS